MSDVILRVAAVAYKAAGRRYFTKKAAYNALARSAIRARCECEEAIPEDRYPGQRCHYHSMDSDRFAKLRRRLSAFIARRHPLSAPPEASDGG
jgi:hypothetical protein